jgi:hypothetical protein
MMIKILTWKIDEKKVGGSIADTFELYWTETLSQVKSSHRVSSYQESSSVHE